jgi:ribosomal protein S18 acetylase RimI-like enzyme
MIRQAGIPIGIREMTFSDCEAVATVRVRGWQHAYAGLMPQAYLDAMSIEKDASRRRRLLAEGDGRVLNLVAERDGEVVGWACFGPSRDDDVPAGTAELYAIYVLPEHLSTGVGRALMEVLTHRVAAARYPLVLLWVLADNHHARRFYEHAGFVPDGAEEPFEVAGVPVPEVRYARRLSASAAGGPSLG